MGKKISALPGVTLPLTGNELMEYVQSGVSKQGKSGDILTLVTPPTTPVYQITKTRAEIGTLIGSSSLVPGVTYKITGVHKGVVLGKKALYDDGSNSGITIFLKAATTNKLEVSGHGLFYNPKYDKNIAGYGIWTDLMSGNLSSITGPFVSGELVTATNGATARYILPRLFQWVSGNWIGATISITNGTETADASGFVTPSYTTGSKVIWGGYAWQNVNGNLGTRDDVLNLDSEWTKLPYSLTDYNLAIDAIEYDYENDLIVMRHEILADNIVTATKFDIENFDDNWGLPLHPISVFMWGNPLDYNNEKGVGCNKVYNSYFECVDFRGVLLSCNILNSVSNIYDNAILGDMVNNSMTNGGGIYNIFTKNSVVSNKINDGSYISNSGFSGQLSTNTLEKGSIIERCYSGNISNNYLVSSTIEESFGTFTKNSFSNSMVSKSQISVMHINTFINCLLDFNEEKYTNKSIQSCQFTGMSDSSQVIIPDVDTATYIFETYQKEVYIRPDGTVKLKFMNNSDTLEIHDITD